MEQNSLLLAFAQPLQAGSDHQPILRGKAAGRIAGLLRQGRFPPALAKPQPIQAKVRLVTFYSLTISN